MNLAFPTDLVPPYAPAGDHGIHRHPSRISEAALVGEVARMRTDPSIEFQTEAAARRHGIPSFAFIKAFKRLTGISPQRFHAALRIEHAKQLLVDTDRPVTDVSLDVGYNSLGTFVRTFRWLVGVSPSQLRRLARGESLNDMIEHLGSIYQRRSSKTIRVVFDAPSRSVQMFAAGLFPQGLPSGLPFDGSFVDPANPAFSLAWPIDRSAACLLAAEVRPCAVHDAWAGRLGEFQVCSINLAEPVSPKPIRLRLRPLSVTDPPFLTPVPLLMQLQQTLSR